MLVRDRNDVNLPDLWAGTVASGTKKLQDDNLKKRCEYLRTERNFSLAFSTAFLAASGVMAKAVQGSEKISIPIAKAFVLAPVGIAALFIKSAFHSNDVYRQCLQDPSGTLARIAAEDAAAEEKSNNAKRVSLTVSEVVGPASWLVGAGAFVEIVASYGIYAVEAAFASGFALCSPALHYYRPARRDDIML